MKNTKIFNNKNYFFKNDNPKTFYGLPKDINFCSICTYSNQKPNSEREYKHSIKKKNQLYILMKKIFVLLAMYR